MESSEQEKKYLEARKEEIKGRKQPSKGHRQPLVQVADKENGKVIYREEQ